MNSGNSSSTTHATPREKPTRLSAGDRVPFLLRAWWLRDFKEYEDIEWYGDPSTTGPLWTPYTDPLCDTGGLDYFDGY